ncbi:helix-turn-helix domain-containing protein [Zobellia amurskyensis]|uniref:Helix-turn-helix domain-containing protein n=1 Tax=Zobellia amurskyensis TaxID=248905 RepID=A0A7X2ZR01_9FLAO|nr:helix-turn-helix domain-containing protein [Zobellia amurskyensis]MUH34787.1 helix-turn-helix domain-containing protein [Zobellia amurskyensis]
MRNIVITTTEELKSTIESAISSHIDGLKILIQQKVNPPKKKLSIKEVAEQLGVTELTIRNYISKGYLRGEKIGRRIWIDAASLQEALSEVKSLKYRRA